MNGWNLHDHSHKEWNGLGMETLGKGWGMKDPTEGVEQTLKKQEHAQPYIWNSSIEVKTLKPRKTTKCSTSKS